MSGLVVSGLTVTLSGTPILRDVSLTSTPARVTGLIGPNGAGKSTLMRAILGLAPLTAGSVHLEGDDLLAMASRDRARRAAFVEQASTTDARLTVTEVVSLARIPFQSIWQASPAPEDEAQVAAALEAVQMTPFATRLYHTLSGGEQQRVQIARALAQQPRLLVLDEPTSHLDIHAQLTTVHLLRSHAAAGATVLLALHDLNLASAFCDHLVVLHNGQVVGQGSPEEVLTPALLRAVYGVEPTILQHPKTGRPLIAYDLPD